MKSKFTRYKKLGNQAIEKGEYKQALDYFERAVYIDPKNPEGWVRKAAAQIYLGDHSCAIESCDEAIRLDRKNSDAYFNRGLALDKRRKYDEALDNYENALRYNPRNIKALNNKGTILGQLERWEEAKRSFEEVLKLDPKNQDAEENLKLLTDYQTGKHKKKCFIATAAYGTPLAPELKWLRLWRDKKLLNTIVGIKSVNIYYKISPIIAYAISKSEFSRAFIRFALRPLIKYLTQKFK